MKIRHMCEEGGVELNAGVLGEKLWAGPRATPALFPPQEAESRPRCRRLQLKDMIPTEMQRLTKYPLLLQSIGQNTGTPRPSSNHSPPGRTCMPGWGLHRPPCLQKSLRNGRKWSWQLSAAGRFCTMSTKLFATWRTCW